MFNIKETGTWRIFEKNYCNSCT